MLYGSMVPVKAVQMHIVVDFVLNGTCLGAKAAKLDKKNREYEKYIFDLNTSFTEMNFYHHF